MYDPPGAITVKLDSERGEIIRKALAAEQRAKLLALVARRAMNVNEIAATLGLSQPTASTHIHVLEEAGLIECEYASTGKGSEKRCWTKFDRLTFELDSGGPETEENVQEVQMPIGLFTDVSIKPTCGLASSSRVIGFLDNPQSFLMPERAEAQILWFADGWIEYTFPCDLPPTAEITGFELVAELCSEAPNYDNEWPSDITVWINGVEVGTWTAPGDFGGRRGRLNPDWWSDSLTQFGALKSWSVANSGCSIDGTAAGPVRLSDLDTAYGRPVVVRIGNKPDAVHLGGLNLFGRRFGNYPQDLILRIRYQLKTPTQVTSEVAMLLGADQKT
jgi:predicted transcriptional regulator